MMIQELDSYDSCSCGLSEGDAVAIRPVAQKSVPASQKASKCSILNASQCILCEVLDSELQ